MSETEAPTLIAARMFINPRDHYWIIGDMTDEVYQSATNTMVPAQDPAYAAWSSWCTATPIEDEATLASVIRAYGLLPAWLWDAPSFIQPAVNAYSAPQLHAYARSLAITKLAAAASMEERLRVLELHAQGETEPAYAVYAKVNPVYVSFGTVTQAIDSGAVTSLSQVNHVFG